MMCWLLRKSREKWNRRFVWDESSALLYYISVIIAVQVSRLVFDYFFYSYGDRGRNGKWLYLICNKYILSTDAFDLFPEHPSHITGYYYWFDILQINEYIKFSSKNNTFYFYFGWWWWVLGSKSRLKVSSGYIIVVRTTICSKSNGRRFCLIVYI